MNLKELAALLGLSQTTVSRAINGYPEVAEGTRLRVLSAAREAGYRANKTARRLAKGETKSVCVAFSLANSRGSRLHLSDFLVGACELAREADVQVVLAPCGPADPMDYLRGMLDGRDVGACILATSDVNDPLIGMLSDSGIPFLVYGIHSGADVSCVDTDYEDAAKRATELMLQLGHRSFALVGEDYCLDRASRFRNGFLRALGEYGISHHETTLLSCEEVASAQAAMTGAIRGRRAPTAVLCSSVTLAFGAVAALESAGLRLGRDVSLVAHDDGSNTVDALSFPVPLTVTRLPADVLGAQAMRQLIPLGRSTRRSAQQLLLKPELIARASTNAAACARVHAV